MRTKIHALPHDAKPQIILLFQTLFLSVLLLLLSSGNARAQTQEWAQTYYGLTSQTDEIRAMVTDGLGNVYVAGKTEGFNANGIEEGTMFLAKYDALGALQWSQTFVAPGFSISHANAIAIDGNGDIIISGGCSNFDNVNSSYWEIGDYFTVKCNAAGQLIWSQTYDGPASHHDFANSLTIDGSNNIYVTGSSATSPSNQSFDIATVKYDAAGVQQWVHRYNGTGSANDYASRIISKSGNLYVCGSSRGTGVSGLDIVVLKYNTSTGGPIWTSRYNGTNSDGDMASDMAVDGSGNVYVAGRVNNYGKPSSNIDANWVTLKYNSSGSLQWSKFYDGSGADQYNPFGATVINADYPTSITLDNSGNAIVTGTSYTKIGSGSNTSTSLDMTTIKYNSAGTQMWLKTYDGMSKGEDCANTIATDGAGNLYISGRSFSSNQASNAVTVKYNASGIQQWLTSYSSGTSVPDEVKAIQVDQAGKVYVGGVTGQDALIVCYGQPAGTFRLGCDAMTSATEVEVFPNPAKDKLYIQGTNKLGLIRLIDQTGKVVLESNTAELKTEIDISMQPPGVYLLTTEFAEGAKLIVKPE